RSRHVHVREDGVRLEGLVAPPDEYGLRVVSDQLERVEVGDDRRHDKREDALPLELASRRAWRRLQLRVLQLEAHLAELLGEPRAGAGRVVGDEPQRMTGSAKLGDRLDGAGDRLSGDVEDTVDVEQNGGHGA